MTKNTILFLGSDDSPLLYWLRAIEEHVIHESGPITFEQLQELNVGFIISYGYRHIIKPDVINGYKNRAVNLHISLLPWNRGSSPNLWSFLENTPKGVTLHYLDEGIDTGDIIAQKQIFFNEENETLSSSYNALQNEIQILFKNHWSTIKNQSCERIEQRGKGNYHNIKDEKNFINSLPLGWNTKIIDVINIYRN